MCASACFFAEATRGNPGKWIARASGGKYVLLAKLGKRWQWVEGTRDDVISSVPDADFEAATRITLLRDR